MQQQDKFMPRYIIIYFNYHDAKFLHCVLRYFLCLKVYNFRHTEMINISDNIWTIVSKQEKKVSGFSEI